MTDQRLVEITRAAHGADIGLVCAAERNFTGRPICQPALCRLPEPAQTAGGA